jgi:hypothetical protein
MLPTLLKEQEKKCARVAISVERGMNPIYNLYKAKCQEFDENYPDRIQIGESLTGSFARNHLKSFVASSFIAMLQAEVAELERARKEYPEGDADKFNDAETAIQWNTAGHNSALTGQITLREEAIKLIKESK